MTAYKGSGTSIDVNYTAGCGGTDHAIFRGAGPISGTVTWTNAYCALGTDGTTNFDPGDPGSGSFYYWVIVAQNAAKEGSYGQNSSSVERPEATGIGSCDLPQDLTGTCP